MMTTLWCNNTAVLAAIAAGVDGALSDAVAGVGKRLLRETIILVILPSCFVHPEVFTAVWHSSATAVSGDRHTPTPSAGVVLLQFKQLRSA